MIDLMILVLMVYFLVRPIPQQQGTTLSHSSITLA